tara:strand:+ start:354 stop:503 length:150 start_codon:yes stop_codon:yes gene_type:complete
MTNFNLFDSLDKKFKAIPVRERNNQEHEELFKAWLHELIQETKRGREFN